MRLLRLSEGRPANCSVCGRMGEVPHINLSDDRIEWRCRAHADAEGPEGLRRFGRISE